jgi:hypothetical protein
MTEVFADIDVSGERREASAEHTEKIAQAVALLLGMVDRIEEEHGLIGLDALFSAYISAATSRIGIANTIEALGNTRARLAEIHRGDT